MNIFPLKTSEDYDISVTLFEPNISNGKLLLINSATGVKQQIYYKFAQYFAKQGFTVVTYDYYGIGLSKPADLGKCNASMRTWGSIDYKAVTQFIQYKFPDLQKFCLGHSVGALILGMNQDSAMFEKFIFVATQKAHVSNLRLGIKLMAYFGFGLLQPFYTMLFGYFKTLYINLGESLPKNAAYDWRTLILHKKSTNRLYEKGVDYRNLLHQKTLVISAEDDSWVTKKGISTLMNETFPMLKPVFRKIMLSETTSGEIGHINFFRSKNEVLWKIPLEFMESC